MLSAQVDFILSSPRIYSLGDVRCAEKRNAAPEKTCEVFKTSQVFFFTTLCRDVPLERLYDVMSK